MTKPYFPSRAGCESPGSDSRQPSEVLERAVAKIILIGARVGVSADQMIQLLTAGMTVEDLLEHVLSLTQSLPETGGKHSARSGLQGTG